MLVLRLAVWGKGSQLAGPPPRRARGERMGDELLAGLSKGAAAAPAAWLPVQASVQPWHGWENVDF